MRCFRRSVGHWTWSDCRGVICGAAFFSLGSLPGPVPAQDPAPDPRTVTLFDYHCASDRDLHWVTLFANGTVRLRERIAVDEPETMALAELAPEQLAGYRRQLRLTDPSDGILPDDPPVGTTGLGVETCDLLVAPPSGKELRYRFGPLEVSSLRYARWVALAEALAEIARPDPEIEVLDEAYEPAMNDVLRDAAGDRYRIVWVSLDGWVEFDGIDQPFHLVYHRSQLASRFVAHLPPADADQ